MIVVVGSSNTDMVVKCERLPVKGETLMGDFYTAGGGKGANQAVAIARLKHEVYFLGCMGKDDFGAKALFNLSAEGVKTNHVYINDCVQSGIALIMVDANGNNIITVAPGANDCLSPKDIRNSADLISQADILLCEFAVKMETIQEAIHIANLNNTRVILTPAPAQKLSRDFLEKVDIIVPNETEAQALTGMSIDSLVDAEKSARCLVDMGVGAALITLGENGSLFHSHTDHFHVKPFHVTATDTTGAGDAFTGALSVALAEHNSIQDSVRFANAVGALSTTKSGAQPSLPYREEVAKFLSHYPKESHLLP